MKVKSGVNPSNYSVARVDGKAILSFATNINPITEKDEDENVTVTYEYDKYTLTVADRPNLENDVDANLESWIEKAKQKEYEEASAIVRAKRNELLADTDKYFAFDRLDFNIPDKITTTTLLASVKSVFEALKGIGNNPIAKYRQALRDIPQQEGFPFDVKFPTRPY